MGRKFFADSVPQIRSDQLAWCAYLQTRYKVRDRFEFPLEIDMFKYTADGLAAMDREQKAAEQQAKQQSSDTSVASRQHKEAVQQQSKAGNAAGSCHMYDLMGVVVHSGSAFTGHYYSYIRERAPETAAAAAAAPPADNEAVANDSSSSSDSRWFCFDDKQVTRWDASGLEPDCFGGKASQDYDNRGTRPPRGEYERPHSAYMLFYERRRQQQLPCSAPAVAGVSAPVAFCGAVDADGDVAMPPAMPSSSGSSAFQIPYSMPLALYTSVMRTNIDYAWQQHVLDKDYFRFVRQLVDSRGDLGQLAARKSRRREASAAAPAAAASGSSSAKLQHSSMSCEGTPAAAGAAGQVSPRPQQAAIAASPMAISPPPAAAAAAAAAALADASLAPPISPGRPQPAAAAAAGTAANGINSLSVTPHGDPQLSPGPSSRRGEDAETVAQALMRLGVLFQFQVQEPTTPSVVALGHCLYVKHVRQAAAGSTGCPTDHIVPILCPQGQAWSSAGSNRRFMFVEAHGSCQEDLTKPGTHLLCGSFEGLLFSCLIWQDQVQLCMAGLCAPALTKRTLLLLLLCWNCRCTCVRLRT
jgi:hypothetical protein